MLGKPTSEYRPGIKELVFRATLLFPILDSSRLNFLQVGGWDRMLGGRGCFLFLAESTVTISCFIISEAHAVLRNL
jgi:hypothetical protein